MFTADGLKLLVANEGEPVTITLPGGGSQLINPEGSVSIIDLSGGAASAAVSTTIAFDLLDGFEAVLKQAGVALLTGQTASADIEPEYITVSPDGTRAYVTLQEVNAVAVIDLTDPAATKPLAILPLGGVDHNLAGNKFDASDRDGPSNGPAINLRNADVISLLQPDSIASFKVGSDTYFVTANEGDARVELDDEATLAEQSGGVFTIDLDNTAYPDEGRDAGKRRTRPRCESARISATPMATATSTRSTPMAAAACRSSSRMPTAPSPRCATPAVSSRRLSRGILRRGSTSTPPKAAASIPGPTTRGGAGGRRYRRHQRTDLCVRQP